MVVVGTLLSYLIDFNDRFNVRIVENIPLGFPTPATPSMRDVSTYVSDAIAVAIVSFTISVSQAKAMSYKHQYAIDQNQEMLAHGLMHSIGSFFGSFAGAAAPPRTFVNDSSGSSSQLSGLISAAVILLVILWLGPLFEALPFSVLGSIITIAIFPLFKQSGELPNFWRLNRYDFVVWVVTLTCSIVLDVDYSLYIGIGVSLLTIIVQNFRAKGLQLVQVDDTELYAAEKLYNLKTRQVRQQVKVFKFFAPLYFANAEKFKQQLYSQTYNPKQGTTTGNTVTTRVDDVDAEVGQPEINSNERKNGTAATFESEEPLCAVVLDCSAITYIDFVGLQTIKKIHKELQARDTHLLFATCHHDVMSKIIAASSELKENFFPSVQDAVTVAQSEQVTVGNGNGSTKST